MSKDTLFADMLEEEASVLEIARAMTRQYPEEGEALIRAWISDKALSMAADGELGFYLDEFGARDTRECDEDEARERMSGEEVWTLDSDTMLHIFPMD